jgi:hypothetical protein
MGYYLGQIKKNTASGKLRVYYFLRRKVWDPQEKRERTEYIAYLGNKPAISLSRAKVLCKRFGIPLKTLKSVRRLKIVEEEITSDEKV